VAATCRKTLLQLSNLEDNRRYYFRVTAVDKNGNEGGFFNQESVLVSMIEPGEEMVRNGDFARGEQFWDWTVRRCACSMLTAKRISTMTLWSAR